MGGDELHPALERLARNHDIDGCLALLARELSPADLTALLLEVMKRRASEVSPSSVARQYRRDRFVRPAHVDARRLLDVQSRAIGAVDPPFEPVVLSPLVPFATSCALAGVHQNRTVVTTRNTEVLSDPTAALALEAATRRRYSSSTGSRRDAVVRLACVGRVVRAQRFEGPRSFAHFSLLGLASAGRDTGNHTFEAGALHEHIAALAAAARAVRVDGVAVQVTDFGGEHGDVLESLRTDPPPGTTSVTAAPERARGRGYYPAIAFAVSVEFNSEEVEVGDGGFVPWTQTLVGSRKERLLTSGLSLERLVMLTTKS